MSVREHYLTDECSCTVVVCVCLALPLPDYLAEKKTEEAAASAFSEMPSPYFMEVSSLILNK